MPPVCIPTSDNSVRYKSIRDSGTGLFPESVFLSFWYRTDQMPDIPAFRRKKTVPRWKEIHLYTSTLLVAASGAKFAT
jgi:ribosomal protein S30